MITIFDHRGCVRGGPNKEYQGASSNDQDDEMCVKVANPIIQVSQAKSTAQVIASIPFPVALPRSTTCLSVFNRRTWHLWTRPGVVV